MWLRLGVRLLNPVAPANLIQRALGFFLRKTARIALGVSLQGFVPSYMGHASTDGTRPNLKQGNWMHHTNESRTYALSGEATIKGSFSSHCSISAKTASFSG
jgi:hypothetical protein